jgi:hypothetical protein
LKFKITDIHGDEIKVGTILRLMEYSRDATVSKIIEFDIDYNDSLHKAIMTNPIVCAEFDDTGTIEFETSNTTKITWEDYPDGPNEYVFMLDDDTVFVNHDI